MFNFPLVQELQHIGIRTGIITNADHRIRQVFESLDESGQNSGTPFGLTPFLVSEEEGIEKPNRIIFDRALAKASVKCEQALHVGDELAAYVTCCKRCLFLLIKHIGTWTVLAKLVGKRYLSDGLVWMERAERRI